MEVSFSAMDRSIFFLDASLVNMESSIPTMEACFLFVEGFAVGRGSRFFGIGRSLPFVGGSSARARRSGFGGRSRRCRRGRWPAADGVVAAGRGSGGLGAFPGLAGEAAAEVVEGFFEGASIEVVHLGVLVQQEGADIGTALRGGRWTPSRDGPGA